MPKKTSYILLALLVVVSAGCETIKGAACGMKQDIANIPNPQKNGWDALERADAWFQEHAW